MFPTTIPIITRLKLKSLIKKINEGKALSPKKEKVTTIFDTIPKVKGKKNDKNTGSDTRQPVDGGKGSKEGIINGTGTSGSTERLGGEEQGSIPDVQNNGQETNTGQA